MLYDWCRIYFIWVIWRIITTLQTYLLLGTVHFPSNECTGINKNISIQYESLPIEGNSLKSILTWLLLVKFNEIYIRYSEAQKRSLSQTYQHSFVTKFAIVISLYLSTNQVFLTRFVDKLGALITLSSIGYMFWACENVC